MRCPAGYASICRSGGETGNAASRVDSARCQGCAVSRSPRSPGHVLIRFDLTATDAPTLLTALGTLEQGLHDVEESAAAPDRDLPSWAARVQAPRVLQDRRRPTR